MRAGSRVIVAASNGSAATRKPSPRFDTAAAVHRAWNSEPSRRLTPHLHPRPSASTVLGDGACQMPQLVAGRLLPNPHLLIQPYIAREALASSRIEGTQASLSDVFDAQARNKTEGPIREVTNYISALEYGLSRLEALPVSRRLLCEVHRILLSDVRGRERLPGEVRRSQNWIGSPDNRPETAVSRPRASWTATR